MQRLAYSLFLYLIVPLVLLRLWRKGAVSPAYRQRIAERFALGLNFPTRKRIWVHAVSVGETIAAATLIRRLLTDHPDHTILLTTTTPTGSQQVQRLFGDAVEHVYFPYDLPDAVARFLRRTSPELIILMETEIWPNLYAQARAGDIPLMLVNARLSGRSFAKYRKLPGLVRGALQAVSRIVAQGEDDAARFVALGADPAKTVVAGNIKFDLSVDEALVNAGRSLRVSLGDARPVWVAASTHQGEDEQVLQAHRRVLKAFPDALLILVPRHPERFDEVAALCHEQGFSLTRRSETAPPDAGSQVFLGDSMGEMMLFYATSDVAFVGGSLVETGGHNPLEPASLGLPVVTGRCVHNFADVFALLDAEGGVLWAENADDLAERLVTLLGDEERRKAVGQRALSVVQENQGAVEKVLREIDALLE